MSHVSPEASVHPSAQLAAGVVVEAGVTIGADCVLGYHVVIRAGSRIGAGVRIDDHAVIGKLPMRAANSATTGAGGPSHPAVLGDGCIVGTGAVIYAGATLDAGVLVADLATIREGVEIGQRTIVGRGVAIENACRVGRDCKLETNAYLTAFSTLEDRVFVAPGVVTTNDNFVGRTQERFKHFKGVTVRRGGRIGANATVLPGITVAEDTLVAAGALVTRDTDPRRIVAGVPARDLRAVPEEQWLEHQGWEP
jgi:UDP-3-O-[3-hydroxymyristoyl] glucosamine N-acyltransferase